MKKKMLKLLTGFVASILLLYPMTMAYSPADTEEKTTEKMVHINMETREITTEEYPVMRQETMEKMARNANVTINIDENGGRIEPYIANPTEEIDPNAIIDGESRTQVGNTTVYPYKTVCYLEVTFPDGTTNLYGSGVLVYKDLVLTAGHVVYKPEHGGYATKIAAFPGRNGKNYEPYQYTTAMNLWVSDGYVSSQNAYDDWAVFETWDSIGDRVGAWMGLAYSEDYSFFVNDGLSVSVVGYPQSKGEYYQYYGRDKVVAADNLIMVYNADATEGQSGGPVYEKDQYVVAIAKGEGYLNGKMINYGTTINKTRFNFIVSKMN